MPADPFARFHVYTFNALSLHPSLAPCECSYLGWDPPSSPSTPRIGDRKGTDGFRETRYLENIPNDHTVPYLLVGLDYFDDVHIYDLYNTVFRCCFFRPAFRQQKLHGRIYRNQCIALVCSRSLALELLTPWSWPRTIRRRKEPMMHKEGLADDNTEAIRTNDTQRVPGPRQYGGYEHQWYAEGAWPRTIQEG